VAAWAREQRREHGQDDDGNRDGSTHDPETHASSSSLRRPTGWQLASASSLSYPDKDLVKGAQNNGPGDGSEVLSQQARAGRTVRRVHGQARPALVHDQGGELLMLG
jgi:hypothetical protein